MSNDQLPQNISVIGKPLDGSYIFVTIFNVVMVVKITKSIFRSDCLIITLILYSLSISKTHQPPFNFTFFSLIALSNRSLN